MELILEYNLSVQAGLIPEILSSWVRVVPGQTELSSVICMRSDGVECRQLY